MPICRDSLDRCILPVFGPDDEGCEEIALPGGYRLGLAHTRLSILDLSPAGLELVRRALAPASEPAAQA